MLYRILAGGWGNPFPDLVHRMSLDLLTGDVGPKHKLEDKIIIGGGGGGGGCHPLYEALICMCV